MTKSSFFGGLSSGPKVVSQTCGGFPPTTKVPQRTSRSPVSPRTGLLHFGDLIQKAALTKRPRAFPLGQDRRGQAGSPARRPLPTKQFLERGSTEAPSLHAMCNARHFPSPSPQAISAHPDTPLSGFHCPIDDSGRSQNKAGH